MLVDYRICEKCMMTGKRDLIVGEACVKLYKDLENVEFNISDMFSPTIVNRLTKVAQTISCSPIYLSNSLLGVLSSLMGDSTVTCTKTHSEPIVVWVATLEMKGTAKVNKINSKTFNLFS